MRATRGGLVLLAVAAVIFTLGVVAGRVSVPRQPAAGQPAAGPPATGATQPPEQAQAGAPPETAAAQPRPTEQEQPSQAAGQDAGPTRVQHGVGVGYTQTREGAVAAATTYVQVLTSPIIFDERRRRLALEALADPATFDRQLQALEESVPAIAEALRLPTDGSGTGGTPVLLQTVPVRVHVDSYGADRATISIWQTSLGGTTAGVPVLQRWGTTTVELRWVDGDWKQVATTSAAGPVPLADDAQPTAASELIGKVQDYEEYIYAPGP